MSSRCASNANSGEGEGDLRAQLRRELDRCEGERSEVIKGVPHAFPKPTMRTSMWVTGAGCEFFRKRQTIMSL